MSNKYFIELVLEKNNEKINNLPKNEVTENEISETKTYSFRLPTYYNNCNGDLVFGINPLSPMFMETYMGGSGIPLMNWGSIGTPSTIPLIQSDENNIN